MVWREKREWKKEIERRAKRVLEVYGYDSDTDTYVDSVRLAGLFGFDVIELDSLPITLDGAMDIRQEPNPERNIIVNKARNFEAKRFIITHELSHYFLHYTGDSEMFQHRLNVKGKDEMENDADYMAACLLMPKNSFRKQYTRLKAQNSWDITRDLQMIYRTPLESVERRLHEI